VALARYFIAPKPYGQIMTDFTGVKAGIIGVSIYMRLPQHSLQVL
jgi:hypothetical protein